jgi:hypothetical protein
MLEFLCERSRRQEVAGKCARHLAREQKVDILREPTELIDQDLDEVAGGSQTFNFDIDFNNFDSNQGLQIGAIVQSDVDF